MVEVKPPQVIVSAFLEKKGRFLIFFDPRYKFWRTPGGRVDYREKTSQAIIREIKEETRITIMNPRFLGYGEGAPYHYRLKRNTPRLVLFFHARTLKEPRIDPHEATAFKWVTLTELKKIRNKEDALNDFFKKNLNIRLS